MTWIGVPIRWNAAVPLATSVVVVGSAMLFQWVASARRRRAAPPPTLVIWDFDWSLINENSDTFVVRELAPALHAEMSRLASSDAFGPGRWTDLMDHVLSRLTRDLGADGLNKVR